MALRIGKAVRCRVKPSKIKCRHGLKSGYNRRNPLPSEVAVKLTRPYVAVAVCCVVFFALVPSVAAQEAAAPRHTGVPHDWSHNHIVFSRDTLVLHPNVMYREPRVLHKAMQRWQAPNSDVFRGADFPSAVAGTSGQHRDWSVTMAGHVSPDMFPAEFSFDAGAPPDCTNDYVVFGLAAVGSTGLGGHANLVAFNNLYVDSTGTGFCSGTAPKVLFAYNITTAGTTGRITTSPVLSLDGKEIAFVESIPGTSAIFHVLTWTAGQGTIANPAVPTMTSLTFSSSVDDTASSPWVDYAADTAYVGSDNGRVYQITGVFKGTPTLSGSPWPVSIGTLHLTAPVLDSVLGRLMVGSSNGNLYQINTATGAFLTLAVGGGARGGLVAAPIVDITNGTTFAVSPNDGTSAVLVQADTASMTQLSRGRIGQGAFGGATVPLYEPALSNNYFTDPSTGVIRLCGTGATDTTPWQYAFGFTGRTMKTTPSFSQQLLTSTTARCTTWTEFFNPNIGTTLGTDFFFFGLTQDCTAVGTAGGCVARITNSNTTVVTATVRGGPSGIIADNYSTAAQASNIYFTAENLQTAYKFTQSGLN